MSAKNAFKNNSLRLCLAIGLVLTSEVALAQDVPAFKPSINGKPVSEERWKTFLQLSGTDAKALADPAGLQRAKDIFVIRELVLQQAETDKLLAEKEVAERVQYFQEDALTREQLAAQGVKV